MRILEALERRTASPNELAEEMRVPLGTVSYHVRRLTSAGLLTLVSEEPRRGAVEHYYRVEPGPVLDAAGELEQLAGRLRDLVPTLAATDSA